MEERGPRRVLLTSVTVLQQSGPCTQMRVLGKEQAFTYTTVGATALFVADCVHCSVAPAEGSACLKLVASWVECDRSSTLAAWQLVSASSWVSTGGCYEVTSVLFKALQSVQCQTVARNAS